MEYRNPARPGTREAAGIRRCESAIIRCFGRSNASNGTRLNN